MEHGSRIAVVAAATTLFVFVGGAGVMTATGGGSTSYDGSSDSIGQLSRAGEVALQVAGGGQVTSTEMNDEDSHYEVEVTFEDGRKIDIQLDEHFVLVEQKVTTTTTGG